jgi:oligopeptide/dipeptide ABC transporter ATP-binding protein
MSDQTVLKIEHLVKEFPAPHGQVVHAVNDVSFRIGRGEALGLVGESGSGKTTVGRCILRLIEPTSGKVYFHDRDVTRISQSEFRKLRSRFQLVFQDPFDSLNPRMRVSDIISEPIALTTGTSAAQRARRANELLELVGLREGYGKLYPHRLSSGEQQRVGIARAIATNPDLVVLDEPTSALDVSVRAEILNLLGDLQARLGMSYLFISHDLTAVRRICHRVAIMYLGRIIEVGETEQIFNEPRHPYSRALLSSVLYPNPRQERSTFLLSGEIPSPINLPSGCPLHTRCPIATAECATVVPPFEEKAPGRWLSCLHVDAEPASARVSVGVHAGHGGVSTPESAAV